MIITCKCGESLTTDLYLTKSYDINPDGPHGADYSVKKGSFLIVKYRYAKQKGSDFWVNPLNVILPKPEFKSGMGCCGLWGEPVVCSACEKEVGTWMLDCHCDKRVEFNQTSVQRRYK